MTFQAGKENWQKNKILQSKEHQYKSYEDINGLIVTERNGKIITLKDGTKLTEFISCSYLGLDQDKRVVNAAMDHILKCGVNFAVSRTRLRTESLVELEELLNKIFCNGYSTVFTSLHITHLGILPLLASGEMPSFPIANNGSLFILDKTVHSSIQICRGILNQFGKVILEEFTCLDKVEDQFKFATINGLTPIAIADGIGSMGGLAPVTELLNLAEKYNGYIYLDDAHGASVFGENGCGYVLEILNNQFHSRLILATSLSKGFGTNGAVVVVPTKEDDEIIKRFCNPYIFSNPPPLAIVDSSIASAHIHLSKEIYILQNQLKENVAYFDSLIESINKEKIINFRSNSPIRGLLIGDEFKAIQYASNLKKRGFIVSAAMYPTVKKGHSLLRITLSADHTQESISQLWSHIKELLSNAGVAG